jgi:hypothetical protein
MWRPILASTIFGTVLLLAGCGGGQSHPAAPSTTAAATAVSVSLSLPATPAAQPGRSPLVTPNVRAIAITDSGLNPDSVTAVVTQPVELQVSNQSSTPCSFSIEGFIQPQTIQPGQSATITFNVTGAATQDRPMGCQGSSARQGVFRLQYTGILPAGR